MAETTLPEEMIVSILSWLPVKSLIRFTCVSKRFHSLILSDPKFAQSQFRAARDRKTPTPRLLCSSCFKLRAPKFESLDLESPSFGDFSSVRELKLPFQPAANYVSPMLHGHRHGYGDTIRTDTATRQNSKTAFSTRLGHGKYNYLFIYF
ncbi:hypothetical protein ACLB2K_056596 [Fragaria x ananassa]